LTVRALVLVLSLGLGLASRALAQVPTANCTIEEGCGSGCSCGDNSCVQRQCGGGGGGGGHAFVDAIVDGFVAVATGVYYAAFVLIAPGHLLDKVGHQDVAKEDAQAAQEFSDHQRRVAGLASEGHDIAVARDELRDAVAGARPPAPRLRGSAAAAPPPYNGPKVAATCPNYTQYACDEAGMLYGDFYASGPIGKFRDEAQMLTCCAPVFPATKASVAPGQNGCDPGSFTNVTSDEKLHCCPSGFPWLNPLDNNTCYESADFRGAGTPAARRAKPIGPTELRKP
jgi:hypothetical protein